MVADFIGQAYIDAKGVITFDINADRTIEKIYHTVLHEVAHCVAGHLEKMTPRDDPEIENLYLEKGPFLERSLEEKAEYDSDPKEVEARSIANELDHYARAKSLDLFGDDSIEHKITILSQIQILRPEEESHEENT